MRLEPATDSFEARLRAIRRHRRAASLRTAAITAAWVVVLAMFAVTAIAALAAVSGRL